MGMSTGTSFGEGEISSADIFFHRVWARFNQATRCFKGLLNYESVYQWYIGQAIDCMIEERVMYAELRPMLLDKFIPTDDGKGEIDNASQMQIIVNSVKAKQADLEAKNELHKFPFGLKIVYCTPRSIPKPMMEREMKHCIELKEKFPDLICGRYHYRPHVFSLLSSLIGDRV